MQQKPDASVGLLTWQVLKELPWTSDYIVVASWYPGIVESTSNESCTVWFMAVSLKVYIFG